MNSVILPTGAQAVYHYARDGQSGIFTQDVMQNTITQKDLIHQMEYDGASSSTTDTWTYSFSSFGNYASVTGPDGSVNADWFYKGNQFSWPPPNPDSWDNHLSIKSEGPEKKIERIWQPNTPSGISSPSGPVVMINPYLKTDFASVKDASGNYTKTFIKDYKVDKNGNRTTVAEYDWVNYGDVPRDASGKPTGIPGTAQVKRVTVNEYFNPTPDSSDSSTNDPDTYHLSTSPNYRQALKSKEARAGFDASTVLSRNEYFYDDPTKMANLTEQRSWDSTKGEISYPLTPANSISVTHQYDPYGNRTLMTDAKGVQTQFIYDPINGHSSLYVTQAKVAAGTAVQRWAKQTYDFHTGLATQTIDVDNNITTNTTYDVFGRPTLVREASGTTVERRTVTEYSEINRRVITRADLNTTGDAKLVTIQHFDQLGRIRLSRNLEDAAVQDATDETHGIKVQTRYAFSGPNSFKVVSAPYRADNSSGAGNEGIMGWTRSNLDMAGRVIEVETFGGAILPFPWGDNSASTGKVVTQYDAELMTVTDQAGKKRRSETDALGRMVKVTEDPGGLSYDTFYLYDVLDNLRKVTQGAQTRWFAYDSLSRLIRVKNPEQNTNGSLPAYTDPVTDNNQWSMAYKYDPNSNLIEKTDARNIKTTYGYDGLNRNTTVSYSDSTPGITRTYDTATLGKGRLQKTETAGGMGSRVTINAYDARGRPVSQSQQFFYLGAWGTSCTTQQTYDLADNVKTLTYPSGHTVKYSHDQAGRLSSFSGNLGGSPSTYADTIGYNAAGQMIKERFGTNTSLYHNQHYNCRLQLADTRLGDSATDEWNWSRGAIGFKYGTTAVATGNDFAYDTYNNGNLRRQNYYVPLASGGYVISQLDDYYYDPLNRIAAVREQQRNESGQWADSVSQAYSYDRWGNRTLDLSGGGSGAVVWVDDALPQGATPGSDGGDSWTWVSSNPIPYSGTVSHQSAIAAGVHQHYFYGATQKLQVNAGDRLYAYVYLDPANTPSEVMLQWADGSGWEHRAYWGANNIGWGANGTASRRYMGPLPATGGWVRLEVPASAVGLEGKTVDGMAFTLCDGRATWDKAGKDNLFAGVTSSPINNRVYTVDAGSNRLTSVNGVTMNYDAAGNNIYDPITGGTMTYDAENRMLTATNGVVGSSYTYDADGRRVKRITGVVETWQIYGIGGELLAEYAAGASPSTPQKEYGYRGGQLLVIAEPGSGGNLAWGKATSQSSTSFGGESSRGVDGNTSGNWGDNSVSHTNFEHQPWWQVDLGSVQQIGTVRLWNRTDCCSERLSNFYVLVSDNPFSSTDLTTTINQAGVSSYYTAGPAGLLTEIGVGRSGRYVRVQLAGDNYLSLAEVEVLAGTASGEGIKWLMTDHLGSTRMVVDRTGSLAGIKRHDFLPFGEELSAGIGIRSASNGYSGDSVRQKFGSKEHDIETGFDYFIARYYSSVQGRFTSVDPGNAGAEMEYPQAWNGYSYAINNPLTYSDPDGLKVKVCDSNGNCTEISDADATKYLFNNKYQQQSGYRLDGKGGVFDTGGNKIGTYQRTSSDDLSAEANAFIFGRGGMIDQSRRAKPIVEAVGAVAALVVATPYIGLQTATLVGADLYDNGGKPSVNTAIVLASGIVPPLKSLHGPEVYESGLAKGSLEYWRKQPTEKIIESLKPGQTEPLITKPDGTIMQGNTRVKVLRERGVDVNSLPRTPK